MKYRLVWLSLLALAFLCLMGALMVAPVRASGTIITVNTTTDELNDDGACSLREAIRAANLDTASGATSGECPAGSGDDTILIPSGVYTLTLPGDNEDANLSGDLDITSTLTISGTDAASTIIDGNGLDRVLEIITGTASVSLVGLTMRQGYSHGNDGSGGGIRVDAGNTLTLTDSALISNTADYRGGGIYNDLGTLKVINSTIISNTAIGQAGGIFNGGTAVLASSCPKSVSSGQSLSQG